MQGRINYMRQPLVFLALCFVTACGHAGQDQPFQWSNQLPAGSIVHIRNGVGDVTVNRSADQSATILGTRAWRKARANDIRFVVEQRGNEYYVCAMWRNSGKCADKGYRGRSTNGFLSMFSLFHRSSDATAGIVATLPANVVVDARTVSGEVQVDGLSAGVNAHTTNGTIRATNVSGPLSLSTTNGDVRLTAAPLAASDTVNLFTTNGSVHADLAAGTEGKYDLSVVNGIVHSDLPLPATPNSHVGRHLAGQIGALARNVKMRAINGEVSVTTHGAAASGQ